MDMARMKSDHVHSVREPERQNEVEIPCLLRKVLAPVVGVR